MASGRTLDGPHPKRPSAGSSSAGIRMSRRGSARGHCASMAAVSRISKRIASDRRVGHAGRRRQGQGAQGGRRGRHRLRRRRARLPDARRTSSRPPSRPAATRAQPPLHAAPAACPSCGRRSPPRPSGTPATTVRGRQVLVTNGGKHAVYNAFAALCDPGDEVLCPAPYWTTYPEAITLAGGVPVVHADRTRRPASGSPSSSSRPPAPTAHQGAAVRVARQPERRGVPARARSRPSAGGPSSTASGSSPTRSTSTSSTAPNEFTSMPSLVPELADTLRRRQRRGQDLRHDRLAGRLDDRPART